MQVVFNVVIVLAAAVVYLTARPYVNDSDDTVNTVAQWAMFIQLFAGLLLRMRVEVADAVFSGGSFNSASLGQFIAVVMALVPCATVTTVVVSQWYSVWEQYTGGLDCDDDVVLANSLSLRRRILLVLGVRSLHPLGAAAAAGSQAIASATAAGTGEPSPTDDDTIVGKKASLQLVSNPLWHSSSTRRS